jgi:hypothetical protein
VSGAGTGRTISPAEQARRDLAEELAAIRVRMAHRSEQGKACDAGERPCVPGAVLPSRYLLVGSPSFGAVAELLCAVRASARPGATLVVRGAERGVEKYAASIWGSAGGTVVHTDDPLSHVERVDVLFAAVRDLDEVPTACVLLAYRTPGVISVVTVQGPAVMPTDAESVRGQKARRERERQDARDAALEAASRRRGRKAA